MGILSEEDGSLVFSSDDIESATKFLSLLKPSKKKNVAAPSQLNPRMQSSAQGNRLEGELPAGPRGPTGDLPALEGARPWEGLLSGNAHYSDHALLLSPALLLPKRVLDSGKFSRRS